MEIIHISAECYPVAKAGGLGDVVGALPKYQTKAGHYTKVVMPMYRTKFLYENKFIVDFKGKAYLGNKYFEYTIIKECTNKLGFDLYLVDINGLLDREKIYGYDDDTERFVAFQIAIVDWLNHWEHNPDIVHCHDHHAGLIPFMMQNCIASKNKLKKIPTILTIHNAQYQGWISWGNNNYIPTYDNRYKGLLDWGNTINSLACAIKCAWKVTTVSNSYMQELKLRSNGLEKLFEIEKGKCIGILNGIDNEVWNPSTDTFIQNHFNLKTVTKGKQKSKAELCEQFGLNIELPLIVFIGRLVSEKSADLLPTVFDAILKVKKEELNILVLGSGDPKVENELKLLGNLYYGNYHAEIGYNETLSHVMYAGADFLLMPSRVEPCGLNQMYAMRYGTIPIVRSTGGLKDTVIDVGDSDGFGIRFNYATIEDIYNSLQRALDIYKDKKLVDKMRKIMMKIDHSWESTVDAYNKIYK